MRCRLALAVPSLVLATACAPTPRPAPPSPLPADEWASTSWEDRHDLMTFAVLPDMARRFRRFRGTSDPDLTCRSCHGADAEKVLYRMPHGLAPLDPEHMPTADSKDPREAEMARFMAEEVTPRMADILGVPPYDPAPRRGFSCFSCHPSATKAAP